ncbi:hypothetical protein SH1V18_21750 [Vallitalea longa]|uniref:Uncharacterized protein n=1 Tax=Vallitalea longa TaxID=2936439 RepID=A0A9W5Y9E5_9FIRM|nr:ABC transporter substrate-binding protein [Vallitalea longa]GKX29695.1 hypothetical protein SH1V18_21750 [Vallitalea longa]
MELTKKTFLSILIIVIVLGVVYLLYNHQSVSVNDEDDRITLNIWVKDSSNAVYTYFTQAIERFEKVNSNINVELKMIQGSDTKTLNYMNTEIINQVSPDVLCLSLHNYNCYATENRLYNLNDYIGKYEEDYFVESAVDYGVYNNNLYGIAYCIDPEILVYRRDFLSDINIPVINEIQDIKSFETYMADINSHFINDNLDKVAFSIPTLISKGTFFSSFLHIRDNVPNYNVTKIDVFNNDLLALSAMYKSFDIVPYDYGKVGLHPFFSGQAAYSIEPLSSIYYYIEKDNNWLRNIGIVPLKDSAIKFSYSEHKYISIMDNTNHKEEAELFFDFFFSSSEVLKRYHSLNMPVVLNSLMDYYLSDINYNNKELSAYIKNSFHYPISSDMDEFLDKIDNVYDLKINKQ